MDTQPVEEIGVDAIETGNSPSLDPVTADTAEHCADSPGQPAESANLEATDVPKNKDAESKDGRDKVLDKPSQATEPAHQEPEVKEEGIEQSSDPAELEANVEPEVGPAGDNVEQDIDPAGALPVKEPEGAAPKKEEEQEDGETPAKKPKVGEEDVTTEPKKVFCEE